MSRFELQMSFLAIVLCVLLTSCDDGDSTGKVVSYEYVGSRMYRNGERRVFSHYTSCERREEDISGITIETVVGDTVVEGKECKLLLRQFSPHKHESTDVSHCSVEAENNQSSYAVVYEELINPMTITEDVTVSEDGAKIFEYIDGRFILKYDFSLKSGECLNVYNSKTRAYEWSSISMKYLEVLNAINTPPSGLSWRVTFDGTDCVWVEGIGASYGHGLIYNPDETDCMFLDSVIAPDGTVRFDYKMFDLRADFTAAGRPWSIVLIYDKNGWRELR